MSTKTVILVVLIFVPKSFKQSGKLEGFDRVSPTAYNGPGDHRRPANLCLGIVVASSLSLMPGRTSYRGRVQPRPAVIAISLHTGPSESFLSAFFVFLVIRYTFPIQCSPCLLRSTSLDCRGQACAISFDAATPCSLLISAIVAIRNAIEIKILRYGILLAYRTIQYAAPTFYTDLYIVGSWRYITYT